MSADWETLIPKPKSYFLRVRCPDCGNEQLIFSHPTNTVKCNICQTVLATQTGGKARIRGEVIAKLE
ncbi:MAG: 30S ribosomal protein S27e [Candidatus Bathyarchaeota archaeon]|nr:MAG: 30S ribosomal protein S27e [Candidatus Bathyarchaeota archaeon]